MNTFSTKAVVAICALGFSIQAYAGNKDRTGQAGAMELMINPWGLSNGVFGLNTANVKGMEAMKGNIAGLSLADGTEVGFAHTLYLRGSNVGISNMGFAQKLGDVGVLGINIQSMTFGEIDITDYNNPDGGIGSYKPQLFNIQAGFAKEFNEYIRAGVAASFINQSLRDARASGACFEAGVQYVTGARNNFHFGVTLRNIGTNMRFSGQGFAINYESAENPLYTGSRNTPTEKFEMPTYLNIGLAYDFYLDEKRLKSEYDEPQHRATVMGSFQSNSFNNDYIGLGAEYAFQETFMLRAAYRYESQITSATDSRTFYTGVSAGATVQYRANEGKGPRFAIDYAFRPTARPNNGVHTFSLRMMFPHGIKKAAGS